MILPHKGLFDHIRPFYCKIQPIIMSKMGEKTGAAAYDENISDSGSGSRQPMAINLVQNPLKVSSFPYSVDDTLWNSLF